MLNVAINGKFMSERMQGIVRYARELVRALDSVLDSTDHVELVVPPNACVDFAPQHIAVVRYGTHTGIAWEQLDFACYLRRHRELVPLNLCNVTPLLGTAGVTTVHDIMYKMCKDYYTTPRNRVSRLWHCLQYAVIARRERRILTVSEFSKQQIIAAYPHARGKVDLVPDAWQHVLDLTPAADWQTRYADLVPGKYLFSMATIARNKNGRWVYEVARRNPQLTFAVAGKRYEADVMEPPSNVHLLGFVTDEDACALMANCRAFLFPSLYEGFGLPPLEALALGATVVSSNATSLPEVLGDSVHYVDPNDYDVDLEELIGEPVAPASEALRRFSWDASARAARDVFEGKGATPSFEEE